MFRLLRMRVQPELDGLFIIRKIIKVLLEKKFFWQISLTLLDFSNAVLLPGIKIDVK